MMHPGFTLSNHARTRMAQRGIQAQALALLLHYGTETSAGGNCMRSRLLDRTARELDKFGTDPHLIAAATKLEAVVNAEGGVVTCYHIGASRRGKVGSYSVRPGCLGARQPRRSVYVYQH